MVAERSFKALEDALDMMEADEQEIKGQLLPFYFWNTKMEKHVVLIACWDMRDYDSTWMDDPDLKYEVIDGNGTILVPDVDLALEKHIFDSEADAILFIKEWWKRQP